MNKVISIKNPTTPYLTGLVVYVVTKMGQFLNDTQARFLISRGDVRVNGETITEHDRIVDLGTNILEVRGALHYIDVIPAGME